MTAIMSRKTDRREFIKQASLVTAGSFLLNGCYRGPKRRPNILYITTDYMRAADVPGPDVPFLKMPNLQNLSENGAVLSNHVTTCPISMPARATMVTGQYPHKHGLWDNLKYSFDKSGPFLMKDLKNLGYRTAGIGKMHFHPFGEDFHFDYRVSHEGQDLGNFMEDDYHKFLREHGYDRNEILKFKGPYNIRGGQTIYDWPLEEFLHHDAYVGDQACSFIEKEESLKTDPWFLWISFTGPHNPWNAPKRCTDLYRDLPELPLGDWVPGELMDKPMEITRHRYSYSKLFWEVYDPKPPEEQRALRRALKASHYGSLTFIDEQLGKIFAAMDSRNLRDDTLIIFSSDHGSALFDNGMLHKGAHYPSQTRVPFIVSWPGVVKAGKRDVLSSHVDLYATIMEAAHGGPGGGESQGKSLMPLLRGRRSHHKDFEIIESTLVSSVLTDRWLVGFHHFNWEIDLYDLTADPMCHRNLASDPAYESVIDSLRQTLVSWRQNLSEGEEVPEDPLAWWECLGPAETVNQYRNNYIKQYRQLAELDENLRPGRVGRHMRSFLMNLEEA